MKAGGESMATPEGEEQEEPGVGSDRQSYSTVQYTALYCTSGVLRTSEHTCHSFCTGLDGTCMSLVQRPSGTDQVCR